MSRLKVTQFGNPILRKKTRLLSQADIASDEIQNLIDDMKETMDKERGVGIAAPQVGYDLQLAIIEISDPKDADNAEHVAIINPSITSASKDSVDDWEGCLSLPDVWGMVPRASEVEISFLDRYGKKQKRSLKGFNARIAQHEIDHLNGILFVDRMKDMSTLSMRREALKQIDESREKRKN